MSEGPIQKILDKTNGGLDIILSLVPDAEKCIGNNRHFKIVEEKTASATLKMMDNGVYWVKCFSSGFSGNGISLYGFIEGKDLKESIKFLGHKYGAFDEGSAAPDSLKPKITKRPATETELPGTYTFDFKQKPSDKDLESIFSKRVRSFSSKQNNNDWNERLVKAMDLLGWGTLNSFSFVTNDRNVVTTESTEDYPIFVIHGEGFKKIYQPKSLDKAYRFRYEGTKPADYIFGYKRLVADYNDYYQDELDAAAGKEIEEGSRKSKKDKEIKLSHVILCSGDADALNVKALGYNVIWLNAEGSDLPYSVFNELKKMCHGVYNLPDLDDTGHKEAHKKGLMHFELKHIALPGELSLKRDWRGNPCKDVRDYFNHWGKSDFEKLFKSALEYKFWDEEINYDREGNPKGTGYVYNDVRALNFLSKCGFHRLSSKTSKTGFDFIKITNNVVKVVEARDVKKFIIDYLKDHYTDNQKLRNTMIKSNRLKDEALENLEYIDLDFKYFDKEYQYFFFKNKTWEVSAAGIQEFNNKQVKRMVWHSKVIPHDVKILEPPFTITPIKNADGTDGLDLQIHNYNCLFMRYLVNICRVHWRTELEERCEEKFSTEEERKNYREKNKFVIDGELLTPDEIREQKAHFINKIFVLGHSLCRYKTPSRPWSPFIMDHVLSKEGESRGGSGKSVFLESISHFMNTVEIDGKAKSLTDDKFAFENVDENTEFIRIEDLSKYTPMEPFFNMITGGLTVNPKHATRFTLSFEHSPRIAFTSNYGVRDVGPSASRRLLYSACSDYYHNNDNKFYREERSISDDIGKNLYRDFTPEEWNMFINTQVNCLISYYKIPFKVNPPMDNVHKRNLMGVMGDAFFQWADVYFSVESERLNVLIERQAAFNDFIRNNNIPKAYGMQKFSTSVEAWCKYYNFEFNPDELKNGQGRIISKVNKKNPDGSFVKSIKLQKDGSYKEMIEKVAAEMIFIKTTGEPLSKDILDDAPPAVVQTTIDNEEESDNLPF